MSTYDWKLLPTEPTAEMGIAGLKAADGIVDAMYLYEIYTAMVGAAPKSLATGEPMARLFCQLLEGCFGEGLLPDTADVDELLIWIKRNYPQLTTERGFSHLPWPDAKVDLPEQYDPM